MMGFGKFFGLGNKDIQEKDVQAAEKELLPKAEVKYEPAELPIEQIQVNPFQPRRIFQKEALQELAASVQEFGILQPLLVRRKGDTAELIAGERRLRAAKMAGLKHVPVLYKELSDQEMAEIAIIENLQREDLSFFEEAEGFARLSKEFSFTQEALAKRMGISQSALANKLRLLKLPQPVQQVISREQLTERHARVLLRLKDEQLQLKALQKIVAQGLNVRQTDELIRTMLEPKKKAEKKPGITGIVRDARIYLNTIRKATKQMESSGLGIRIDEEQEDDYVLLHIRVPKKKAK